MAEREIKVNIGGDTTGLDKALSRGQANLLRFAKVGAAAIAATGVAMLGLTKASLANIDVLAKQARSLGLTTAAFQKMTMVAGEAGVEAGQLSAMLGLMQRNVIELQKGTKLQTESFAKMGLSIKDLQGLSPDEQFRKIAEGLNKITDPAAKTAAAMDIFGRSGRGAINMLEGYSAKIAEAEKLQKELGITVSQFDSDQIEAANDAFGRIGMVMTGLGNIMAVQVAPAIIAVSEGIVNAAKSGGILRTAFESIGGIMEGIAVVITGLAFTHVPALIASIATMASGLSIASVATGVFTAAVNLARVATIALGGPLGIVWGLIGAAGAAWIVYGRQSKVGEDAAYDVAAAEAALRGELEGLATSSSPAARTETVKRIQSLKEHATAALAAAQAELAVAQAQQAAASAIDKQFSVTATGNQGYFKEIDDGADTATNRVRELQINLLDLSATLRDMQNSGGEGVGGVTPTGIPPVNPDVPTLPGGLKGGAGIASDMAARLESLQEGLMTEREVVAAWYEEGQTTLAQALEAELITRGEYAEAIERLEQEHQEKLSSIKSGSMSEQLRDAAGFFGAMASVVKTGGAKALKASQILSAAQGLINSYVAFTEVLKDPSFIGRPLARIAAAGGVLAAGLNMVQAIKGVSASGGAGGGGGGAASAGTAAPAQQPATTFAFTLQNDPMGFGESFARQLIDQLNATQRNGGQIRGVMA